MTFPGVPTLAVVLVLALGTTACGGGAGAADQALANRLDAVDAAVSADDPARLRDAVDDLLDQVAEAEGEGDLDASQAARIRSAARALLAAADVDDPAAPQEPSTSAPPPPPDQDEETEDAEPDEGDDASGDTPPGTSKGKSKGKGKAKGHDD